jgi:hypothetical protein
MGKHKDDEDVERAKYMLTPEDFDGGFHNVEPPAEFYAEEEKKASEAETFIGMDDSFNGIPHKTDRVQVVFSPEELVILTQVLENYSTHIIGVEYVYEELGYDEIYQHQTLVRGLRDVVNDTLEHYIKVRPYSPFIVPWVNRIGKGKIRNKGQK